MPKRVLLIMAGGLSLCSGCQGVIWGNLAILAVSVGIFMGTLSLGRSADPEQDELQSDSERR